MVKIIFFKGNLKRCHNDQEFFLSWSNLVASKISETVTGEFFRLNTFSLYEIFSVGDFLEGLILLTTLTAPVAKKLLNDSAITEGSVMAEHPSMMAEPSTFRTEQLSFLF